MHARIALAGALAFAVALGLAAAVPLAPPREVVVPTPTPRHTAPPLVGDGPPPAGVGRGSRARPQVGPLRIPIAGQGIPEEAALLPEATRDYRAGVHEGIDFAVAAGTPVLAAADGEVIRADRTFTDWSTEERTAALAEAVTLSRTPARTLDLIRGRQVWVDHGRGIVTRYAHLESVGRVAVGDRVRAGEVIGAVGSSGLPEGGPHLHFEIRIADSYLGDGLTPAQLARALREALQ